MNSISSFRPLQKLSQWFQAKTASTDPVDSFRRELHDSLDVHLQQSRIRGWGRGDSPQGALQSGFSISAPALGEGKIEVKSTNGGALQAFRDGQALPVKNFPSQRFFSRSGAIGNDPSRDEIDLGGGRTLTLQPWEKGLSVTVRQENSDATLKMWWNASGKPGSASLRSPLVEIGKNGRVDEWTGRNGPVEGRLTSFDGEKFQARQWWDGMCDPVATTQADIDRLQGRARQLMQDAAQYR